jgi:hypothetical protein
LELQWYQSPKTIYINSTPNINEIDT